MTDEPYRPPTSRREAVDEIIQTGYTTSALLAVALGFPLDGEVAETANSKVGRMLLGDYGGEACRYLTAWGRNSCEVKR